ncbi:MAG: hypothetical protein BGO09_00745 [Bacteroidetes bacterium 47-18]|nr:MAG: hypothetical protein BGO09_00745 [Bacteroidetes bacterium 47-18]
MHHLWESIAAWPWLEITGVFFSVLQVLYARKNNPVNYIFGIIGVAVTIYIFYGASLYAEAYLNLYYLVMSVYGLYIWQFKRKDERPVPISSATRKELLGAAGIVVTAFVILYTVISTYTDSLDVVWDATVAAFAWAGMWLMAKRKVENWLVLNISNFIAVPLQIHKGLYLYAALTAFLFIVASVSYFEWRKMLQAEGPGSTKKPD